MKRYNKITDREWDYWNKFAAQCRGCNKTVHVGAKSRAVIIKIAKHIGQDLEENSKADLECNCGLEAQRRIEPASISDLINWWICPAHGYKKL